MTSACIDAELNNKDSSDKIPISALNQYSYCPRRCYLIHAEGEFTDNIHTESGTREHERVDQLAHELKQGVRVEFALPVWSERLGLSGRCDVVESHPDGRVYPVEYKHGKRKQWLNDDLQLAAQAMCLEEMLNRRQHPALMGRCAADGRSIVWLNRSGRFQARMEGPVNGNILLRQAQFRAADQEQQTLKLAQRFIAGKIRNSRQVLMRGARDSKDEQEKAVLVRAARLLAGNLKKLAHVQNTDEARGLEGDSARIYFAALPNVIRPLSREAFAFTTRNRRPPRDCFNALISFL